MNKNGLSMNRINKTDKFNKLLMILLRIIINLIYFYKI